MVGDQNRAVELHGYPGPSRLGDYRATRRHGDCTAIGTAIGTVIIHLLDPLGDLSCCRQALRHSPLRKHGHEHEHSR